MVRYTRNFNSTYNRTSTYNRNLRVFRKKVIYVCSNSCVLKRQKTSYNFLFDYDLAEYTWYQLFILISYISVNPKILINSGKRIIYSNYVNVENASGRFSLLWTRTCYSKSKFSFFILQKFGSWIFFRKECYSKLGSW